MTTLYELEAGPLRYPYLLSDDVEDTPIPWVAISGLSGDRADVETVWAVSDSLLAPAWVYASSRHTARSWRCSTRRCTPTS